MKLFQSSELRMVWNFKAQNYILKFQSSELRMVWNFKAQNYVLKFQSSELRMFWNFIEDWFEIFESFEISRYYNCDLHDCFNNVLLYISWNFKPYKFKKLKNTSLFHFTSKHAQNFSNCYCNLEISELIIETIILLSSQL